MDATFDHGRGEMVWAGHVVSHDFGIRGIRDRRFENADDRPRSSPHDTTAETYGLAENIRIAMKGGGPEAVGKNDDARCFRTIVLRSDEAAENGVKPHHVEIGSADNPRLDLARLTQADHGKADSREIAEFADGLNARFNILQFRDGEVGIFGANPWRTLTDINEAVFVAIHERAK